MFRPCSFAISFLLSTNLSRDRLTLNKSFKFYYLNLDRFLEKHKHLQKMAHTSAMTFSFHEDYHSNKQSDRHEINYNAFSQVKKETILSDEQLIFTKTKEESKSEPSGRKENDLCT